VEASTELAETGQGKPPPQVAPQQRTAILRRLYYALIAGERLTRTALATDARVSGGVVGKVIEDLRWRDMLRTVEAQEPGIRGPKTRYELNADRGRVLAIGFGQDRLGVVVTDLSGEVVTGCDFVDPVRTPGSVERNPTGALERAATEALAMPADLGNEKENLVGVGISLPAPLMNDGRMYAGFMDAWQQRHIDAELRRLLDLPEDCPIVLHNDANLTALRELRRGAARGAAHACVIRWGAGVGAGLILDGHVYLGPTGLAGEIGHLASSPWVHEPQLGKVVELLEVPEGQRTCVRCGQPCLEALISASGLLNHLRAKQDGRPARFNSITEVIDAGLQRDAEAQEALDHGAHLLGHALGPIVSALNLQLVVVDCFGDENAFQLIIDGLRSGLSHRMNPAVYQQLTVKAATAVHMSAILGAADVVVERHLGNWVGRRPLSPPRDEDNATTVAQIAS
jgi:predicted NBD/HSP70 family sugar kinase